MKKKTKGIFYERNVGYNKNNIPTKPVKGIASMTNLNHQAVVETIKNFVIALDEAFLNKMFLKPGRKATKI